MKLSPMQYDILKEIFNVGVGKSASLLSEIVKRRIFLNVPHLELVDLNKSVAELHPHGLPDGTLVVSSIRFKEKLAGVANLIFPADKMRQFLNLCQGEEAGFYQPGDEFDDIDLDIIKEVANIVLNSIVGELGNFLNLEFDYTLPQIHLLGQGDLLADLQDEDKLFRLMLFITFRIDETEINGAIIIDMTLNSLQELVNTLDKLEVGLYE